MTDNSLHIKRNGFMDFLKMTLIFLVVFGHSLSGLKHTSPIAGGIYQCIYSFHMPLFIFISGYFSKNIDRQRRKDIELLLYPYLVWQIFNYIITYFFGGARLSLNLFVPYHQNWYLLSLFMWRWAIPYCQYFKKWVIMSVAILLAFMVGYFSDFNTFLSLHKTFYFFPFFLLGYYCPDIDEFRSKLHPYRWWLSLLFVVAMIGIFSLCQNDYYRELLNFTFLPDYGYSSVNKLLARFIGFCSSLMLCVSFICIGSSLYNQSFVKINFSGGGKNTMLIYLIHYFFFILLRPWFAALPIGMVIVVGLVLSASICYIFSREKVVAFFEPLYNMRWIYQYVR